MTEQDKKIAFELAHEDGRIVPWAHYGEHITIKCKKCGTEYSTKNIGGIGCRSIFFMNGERGKCCSELIDIKNLEVVEPTEWELV